MFKLHAGELFSRKAVSILQVIVYSHHRFILSLQSLLLGGLIEENDITKDLLSAGTAINANLLKST